MSKKSIIIKETPKLLQVAQLGHPIIRTVTKEIKDITKRVT